MLLEDLRTFVVLVESGDAERAARGLHVSTATVQRSVGRLEQLVGGTLLDRRAPGVRLTGTGEQVLDKALDVLEAAADLLHAIHRPAHRPYVVVGALYRMLVDELADAAAAVDPLLGGDVSLEFRESGDEDPTGGLGRGRVDAAVLAGPTDLDDLIVRRSVAQVPRVALLAAHHPLAGRSGVEVRQLAADVWLDDVSLPDASWPAYWRCEDVRGGPPATRIPVSGGQGIVEAVRLGAGVAVRPAPLAPLQRTPGIVAVPLVDVPPCPVDLAYRHDTPHAPFFDSLAERVAADLDSRPVGLRIRASSVVSGVVVSGLAPRRSLPDPESARGRGGLRGRLRAIGGRRPEREASDVPEDLLPAGPPAAAHDVRNAAP